MDIRIISIGAMARHPLWKERDELRTGHATTTLIRTAGAVILVDPGLPEPALAARLGERAGIRPTDVTHVFLTSFQPEVFRGITLFDSAKWLISGDEREIVGVALAEQLRRIAEDDPITGMDEGEEEHSRELMRAMERDVAILRRCEPAPDTLAGSGSERVDLFPLPGVTPGTCGLLIPSSRGTVLVCGDAVATVEHIEQGKLLPRVVDVDRARESFTEALEIADVLIPGRDNIMLNPAKGMFS